MVPKGESRGVKILRLLLWLLVILGASIGISFLGLSRASESYMNGTTVGFANIGAILIGSAAALGSLNFTWGLARWLLRWDRQGWSIGRAASKLIGGGIWRAAAIIPLAVLSFVFIAPLVTGLIGQGIINEAREEQSNSTLKLKTAYESGKIDADTYIQYLIHSVNNTARLPKEYHSENNTNLDEVLREVASTYDKASAETVREALHVLSLPGIDFDADGDNSSSTASIFSENVYAAGSRVKYLNRARLSSKGRFLVFYMYDGEEAISDSDAEGLAEMLEEIADDYETHYGVTFRNNPMRGTTSFFSAHVSGVALTSSRHIYLRGKMEQVMMRNGIDKSYLDSAMPIYVTNPFTGSSSCLASYVGEDWGSTYNRVISDAAHVFGYTIGLGDEDMKENVDLIDFYQSSPVMPFINILPKNIHHTELKMVTAHEMGHHIASNYCHDESDKRCADEGFISETMPQYSAVTILDNLPTDLHRSLFVGYNGRYLSHISEGVRSENLSSGYAQYAFLVNYGLTIPDANRKILDALMVKDAYHDLYNKIGKNGMKKVLHSLAVKSLTMDYGDRTVLMKDSHPKGSALPCKDLCSRSYARNVDDDWVSSSVHYFYFTMSDFGDRYLTLHYIAENEDYEFIFLGEDQDGWHEIPMSDIKVKEEGPLHAYDLVFDNFSGKYHTIALAVTDFEEKDDDGTGFSMAIGPSGLKKELEEEEELENKVEPFFGVNGDCIWFYTDGMFNAATKLSGLMKGKVPEFDQALEQWRKDEEELEDKVGRMKITVCGRKLSPKVNFDLIRTALNGKSLKLKVFEHTTDASRTAVDLSYNPFSREAGLRGFSKDSEALTLLTARIEPVKRDLE